MSSNTQGFEWPEASPVVRRAVELLSSMRFSISLLTVICIASVVGTVLKQNEPAVNYVNQFGPFWAEVFTTLQLHAVYSAWWFLLILAFLVVSTSLCIARNTPKILVDWRTFKEGMRESSLKAFSHKAQGERDGSAPEVAGTIGNALVAAGWRVRVQPRDNGTMVAAKKGAANKLGYIAAHSAIVLVCLGGLLDGDLMVRAQTWFNGKEIYRGGGLLADVPAQHRLSDRNPTFRANLLVAEGTQSSTAVLNQSDGVLLQELPFSIELKKFIVDYYSTGMPKLFASEIVIHDKATGEKIPARVEVNHPASHRGINIYQSSFDDGGSRVKLRAVPMNAATVPFEIEGTIGSSSALARQVNGQAEELTLEYTGLRLINVENFAQPLNSGADVRKVDLQQAITQRLGAANKTVTQKTLRNVGPSVSYKLRDQAGQAREFNNYMLPVDMEDGNGPVFLLGVRDTPSEDFRYLRVPADPEGSMDTFVRMRQALLDPKLREQAVQRYVAQAVDPSRPELAEQLRVSADRALTLFAGQARTPGAEQPQDTAAGLQAISDFMDANVPESERSRAGEVLVRILNGVLFELAQQTRAQAGSAPLVPSDATQTFMTQAVLSLSDAPLYPAPMVFALTDFTQVQASVFQVARAPGQNVVYLGCLLLILGIFAMLYVRDRRLWVWVSATPEGSAPGRCSVTLAMSSNRDTMDMTQEFDRLQSQLLTAKP
jgi:cytochrome c biogenesis protein